MMRNWTDGMKRAIGAADYADYHPVDVAEEWRDDITGGGLQPISLVIVAAVILYCARLVFAADTVLNGPDRRSSFPAERQVSSPSIVLRR
jgi:hypothetical protein